MSWVQMTVAVYAAMVRERVHFAEAGYRDGEWYAMLGISGSNINGERYTPELGARLRATLLEPAGQWCAFWWPHPTIGQRAYREAMRWLEAHDLTVSWLPDRPISRANELGEAAPFFQACRTRDVVLVGPSHMADLDLFPVKHHITVPESTAWQHTDRLCAEILVTVEKDDLVLFAAGMASNLMIHELWPTLRGMATLLDIGATLDPYCGKLSRAVYREPEWPEHMARNMEAV